MQQPSSWTKSGPGAPPSGLPCLWAQTDSRRLCFRVSFPSLGPKNKNNRVSNHQGKKNSSGMSGAFSCAKHFADRPPRIKMNYEMGTTLQREKVRLGCGQMPRLGFPHACLLNNHEPFCPEAPGLPHAHSRTFMHGWPVLELP